MAKVAKDDFDDVVKDDVAPSGKKDKLTLQNAFLDWKRRQVSKAQPKKGGGVGSAGSKAPSRGAKPRADDAEAKSLSGNSGGVAQAKPPAPFVADAYKPKQVVQPDPMYTSFEDKVVALPSALEPSCFFEQVNRLFLRFGPWE